MTYLLIWLLKICVTFTVGYFITKLFRDSNKEKEDNLIGEKLHQQLKANQYDNLSPDITSLKKIEGLKFQSQIGQAYQKPQFYFGIDKNTTREDITLFLKTIPDGFQVNIPALKISLEDSKPKEVVFWKESDQFLLAFNQSNEVYKYLNSINLEELANNILAQSTTYTFQNVKVERLIIQE